MPIPDCRVQKPLLFRDTNHRHGDSLPCVQWITGSKRFNGELIVSEWLLLFLMFLPHPRLKVTCILNRIYSPRILQPVSQLSSLHSGIDISPYISRQGHLLNHFYVPKMSKDRNTKIDDIDLDVSKLATLPNARDVDIGEVLETSASEHFQKKVLRKIDLL